MPDANDPWERHAAWWQDGFTDGADPEYEEQVLPLAELWLGGFDRVLDIGTGEGQIARRLRRAGCDVVVGVDPTAAQIAAAAARGGGVHLARSGATALPFPDAAFDAVLACLVFEHLPDHVAPINEVARVLRLGGRFAFFLNHPLLQCPGSGWIDDHILEEQYWRVGPYLEAEITVEQPREATPERSAGIDQTDIDEQAERGVVSRLSATMTMEEIAPGVVLPFVHRPVSHYVNALSDAGLRLVRMEEPAPPPGFIAQAPEYQAAATIPRLLLLICERVPIGPYRGGS